MTLVFSRRGLLAGFALGSTAAASARAQVAVSDPLPSWSDGAAKSSIIEFVALVRRQGGTGYVPPPERIAVFDNDGTLWTEQPIYFQGAFAVDRVKALASRHPEWSTEQPFKGLLEGDIRSVAASGQKGLLEIIETAHANATTEQFAKIVDDWVTTARHPRFARLYTDLVYQPMLELLVYLRANEFKTFIVSGGGIEFMRPWAERVYGIPPEQVVGSSGETALQMDSNGKLVLMKLPKVEFIDDGPGKPVGINRFIGRRPILAFGNSDGDQQMLEWTADRPVHLVALVHHTDSEREYAYDRQSKIGKLDKALDEAVVNNWTVVDMKRDWLKVFPDVQ